MICLLLHWFVVDGHHWQLLFLAPFASWITAMFDCGGQKRQLGAVKRKMIKQKVGIVRKYEEWTSKTKLAHFFHCNDPI